MLEPLWTMMQDHPIALAQFGVAAVLSMGEKWFSFEALWRFALASSIGIGLLSFVTYDWVSIALSLSTVVSVCGLSSASHRSWLSFLFVGFGASQVIYLMPLELEIPKQVFVTTLFWIPAVFLVGSDEKKEHIVHFLSDQGKAHVISFLLWKELLRTPWLVGLAVFCMIGFRFSLLWRYKQRRLVLDAFGLVGILLYFVLVCQPTIHFGLWAFKTVQVSWMGCGFGGIALLCGALGVFIFVLATGLSMAMGACMLFYIALVFGTMTIQPQSAMSFWAIGYGFMPLVLIGMQQFKNPFPLIQWKWEPKMAEIKQFSWKRLETFFVHFQLALETVLIQIPLAFFFVLRFVASLIYNGNVQRMAILLMLCLAVLMHNLLDMP